MTVSEFKELHDRATKEWLDAVDVVHTCPEEEEALAMEMAQALYDKGQVLLKAWATQKRAEKAVEDARNTFTGPLPDAFEIR